MNTVISDLVSRFDEGTLSRRDLVQGLTILTAAAGTAPAQAQPRTPFVSNGIDHISIQVTDLERSIAFYQTIFGLAILNQDIENRIVRMGRDRVIVSLHAKAPTGIVDHYAIAIDNFDRDAVAESLAAHGYQAQQNLDYGFYVRDPEGVPVQIVGG
ncbi:MAG: VOC family protein [Gammaproteobacteria bacterium]|jgi:predicted enzyme related to lactoylglutathione lyase